MKTYELKFTLNEADGQLHINAHNDGFSFMELVTMLEMKKLDILAQSSPDVHFKRLLIDEDGNNIEIKGENE